MNAGSVKYIFNIDEKSAYDSLKTEVDDLNKKINDLIEKLKSNNNISNLNLLCCPACEEYIKIESIDTKELEFKIKFNCPKNSHKFENKNLSEFIKENKQNNININYLCDYHNEYYKYFCLKCNVIFSKNAKIMKSIKINILIFRKKYNK